MTRAPARSHFHSSQLLRFLADLSLVQAAVPAQAFAEKLGQWLDYTDAITLCAVHNASPASTLTSAATAPRLAAGKAFARVQAELTQSICHRKLPGTSRTSPALPEPQLELPLDPAAAYTPYRRYYQAQQRQMELSIRALRAQLRETLTPASPALRKLAALDAALDGALHEREASLLAKLPKLFELRFAQLFQVHQNSLAQAGQVDQPANWMQTGAWLARFCQDLQTLLLAELDFRMQPALGLLEALNHEMTPSS